MEEQSLFKPSNLYWEKSLSLSNIKLTLRGYSRAAYRTGFYIKELDLMLDAGPANFNKPKNIFIGHTHGDHIASLPLTLIGDQNGNHIFEIYAPSQAEEKIHKYINAFFEVNALATVDTKNGTI